MTRVAPAGLASDRVRHVRRYPMMRSANAPTPRHEQTTTTLRRAQRGRVKLRDLATMTTELPLRQAVRALVIDDSDRVLLVKFSQNTHEWWAMPGGGIEGMESELDVPPSIQVRYLSWERLNAEGVDRAALVVGG